MDTMSSSSTSSASGRGTLLILNGPNLNMLGTREPEIYGSATLADVEKLAADAAAAAGFTAQCVQSNHEGVLLDAIHAARGTAAGIIINAGAYTHTSVAIRDALEAAALPFVEVHISNVHAREAFRHHSFLSDIASCVIAGAGIQGYAFGVHHLASVID